jgi:hypothetical protein
VCAQFPQGCVTDGSTAGQPTPLYYQSSASDGAETWWDIKLVKGSYYSIRNAHTGQYVTYDGVREDIAQNGQLRRYVSMTSEMDGDNSLWYFEQQGEGVYAIRNMVNTDQLWDVRVDSYCVGTYSNAGWPNMNQQFSFYDAEGILVTEGQANDTGNGFDVSSWLDATAESLSGWSYDGVEWSCPDFGDYHNGDAYVTIPFLERWNDTGYGSLPDGRLYQELQNLPPGDYVFSADMIAVRQPSGGWWGGQSEQVGTGVYLFAADMSTQTGSHNEAPVHSEVRFTVSATGTVTLGVNIRNTNANWVAVDNFALLYQGTADELVAGEKAKVRAELSAYYTQGEIEELLIQAGDDFFALEMLRKAASTMPAADPLSNAAKGITIDGRSPVYVESLDMYLCTLPLEQFGQQYPARIDYVKREGCGSLSIEGTTLEPGDTYVFRIVRGGRVYKMRVKDAQGNLIEKDITFTSLPVVKMTGNFSNSYSQGTVSVNEPDKGAAELLRMKAKWRGGITNSNGKHKRNYHVKLLDDNGEKLERSFFGLRNDNSWILESCQVDMSRIRNRMLTDLWNDFSTPPYYKDQEKKALTGSRGRFVELVLNGEYRGIYCMTENVDRKQLKLKKTEEQDGTFHGGLWKSKDWSFATLMGTRPDGGYYPKDFLSTPYEGSEMWDSYEVKYPDMEDTGYYTDWQPLYDAVDFVCYSDDDDFRQRVGQYFDLPVVMDYYILMETILATDNHGKNMFFGIYDRQQSNKITFAVWDMDATSGQRWSDDYYHWEGMRPDQDYSNYVAYSEHGDYNLFRRLRNTDAEDFNMKVRLRYRDLRQNYLATESILDRFRTQLNEFKTCGAAQREYDRWSYDSDVAHLPLNFDTEMAYIEDWFTRRMEYLDTQRFDIESLPSEVTGIQVMPGSSAKNGIYNLRGQKVGTTDAYQSLPPGVYVIGGKKMVKD